MNIANSIFLVTGTFVILIGLAGFINPNWTRWINFPGGPRLKSIGAIIIGVILVIVSFAIEIPME
jgi:hypothetical protein